MFTYDSRGIQPSQGGGPIPEGEYLLKITKTEDGMSRSGYPMVKVTCQVSGGPQKGATVFNNVTFLPQGSPGAGIAIHFLKCIGEPWEEMESLDVDPERWIGKQFIARVVQELYKKPDGTEITTNKIKGVEPEGIGF